VDWIKHAFITKFNNIPVEVCFIHRFFNSRSSFWFYYDVSVWTRLVKELFASDLRSGLYFLIV